MHQEKIMRYPKYRAFYKPDFLLKKYLPFVSVVEDYDLYFVMEEDHSFRYHFSTPFMDDDWIVDRDTGLTDSNENPFFENDYVVYTTVEGKFRKLIKWSSSMGVACVSSNNGTEVPLYMFLAKLDLGGVAYERKFFIRTA